jgi:hypothetical protein
VATVFYLINSKEIASYWEELLSNRIPYIGEGLFPAQKRVGLDLSWIRGKNNLPVRLRPSAFDAKPTLRDRGKLSLQQAEMPFFREAMQLSERDRQQLLSLGNSNNALLEAAILRLFDDAAQLIEGALVIPEIMRLSLMQTGKFAIVSDVEKVSYEYDYDDGGSWAASNVVTLLSGDRWDQPTSHKIRDILAIKRAAVARGKIITRAIIGPKLWARMLEDETIGKDIFPLTTRADLSDSDLQTYLSRKTGITFSVNEKLYMADGGAEKPFVDDDKVIFLPSGTLGTTYFGTTPEEADLQAGYTNAQVSIVSTGVAITTKVDAGPPVNNMTWVSEIVLPSFENMDSVWVLKAV